MARCPSCGSASILTKPIRQCRRCGPILGTVAATEYLLMGRRPSEAWSVILGPTASPPDPSPACLASWPELQIIRLSVTTQSEQVALWRNGILVGADA